MRVYTRGDMDGLTSVILLSYVEDISELLFAHPKDMQDGLVEVGPEDIITNLPYVQGCALWFDHHVSEETKLKEIGEFKGRFELAPSVSRVIYNHYKLPEFDNHLSMLEATDKLDSGNLTEEEVKNPEGWQLLGLTLDPRTGLGPYFGDYFRWLAGHSKDMPLEKIMEHDEVKKRVKRILGEKEEFENFLKEHSRLEDNVVITDLRDVDKGKAPVGNRFIIYILFPEANVAVRIFRGKDEGGTVLAVGKSIFNPTCKLSIGELLSEYGGGGHESAGTVQMLDKEADEKIVEIIEKLKES